MTKTLTAVTSAACWQAYRAPSAALTGSAAFATILPVQVAPMFAAAPLAVLTSTTFTMAAAGHVQAVAGVEPNTTAPKQADKPSVTRNDANPDRFRPGAPPS